MHHTIRDRDEAHSSEQPHEHNFHRLRCCYEDSPVGIHGEIQGHFIARDSLHTSSSGSGVSPVTLLRAGAVRSTPGATTDVKKLHTLH